MLSYESQVINKTGVFPSCVAKNASTGSSTDGTEYVATLITEEWGFWQALLAAATMTPNGVPEAYNASQKLQAMKMLFGAPGEYVFDGIPPVGSYGLATISYPGTGPNGRQDASYQYRRIIPCQGQALLVANYPDLANALYPGDANNATAPAGYRATTNSNPGSNRSTSGTYFVLPDFRGLTIRGYDPAPVRDPGGATRGLLGSLQQDAFQGHWHSVSANNAQAVVSLGSLIDSPSGVQGLATATITIGAPTTDGTHGTPRTDSETRMFNASCNIGVRY